MHSACFATTHWSGVLAASGDSPESAAALEQLCRGCWYPLYSYVRRCGHAPHDTQAFFAEPLRKQYFRAADRQRGEFHSFLLTALKHFMAHEWEKARAAKRRGGLTPVCLDEQVAERCYQAEPTVNSGPERACDRAWALRVFERDLGKEEFIGPSKSIGKTLENGQIRASLVQANASLDHHHRAAINSRVKRRKRRAPALSQIWLGDCHS